MSQGRQEKEVQMLREVMQPLVGAINFKHDFWPAIGVCASEVPKCRQSIYRTRHAPVATLPCQIIHSSRISLNCPLVGPRLRLRQRTLPQQTL